MDKQGSDYYTMKTMSPFRMANNAELSQLRQEESSSSLLDLDNNDMNFTSYVLSPSTNEQPLSGKQTKVNNFREAFSSSPYQNQSAKILGQHEDLMSFGDFKDTLVVHEKDN